MASNVLPLRLAVQPGMTVSDVVEQASQQIREGLRASALSAGEHAPRCCGGDVDGRTLFGLSINVMPFDYGFSFAGHRATAHNLSLGPVEDLSISVYDRADGEPLRIDFDVNPALHTSADLAMYRQRFLRLLTAHRRCRAPDRQSRHSGAGRARHHPAGLERHRAGRSRASTVPELFAAQAARTPDAAAVMFEDRALSYAALDAHANRLAHHLQSLGVGPETVVGLCVERSPEMLIGLLGILKAGGAYLPLDPNYPRERLEFMLADAGVPVLVTQSALMDRLPAGAAATAASCGSTPTRPAIARQPEHRAAARSRSAPPGLRDLHLGLDRRAEGRRRRARKPDQQDARRSAGISRSTNASARRC